MATHAPLEGHFASDEMRRWERRFQFAGVVVLAAVVLAAAVGVLATPESVARAAGVYLFLLAVFRVSGRRTLAQVTNFDLVLVLIIGDATQQALVGSDYTLTSSLVVISTLVLMDIALGQGQATLACGGRDCGWAAPAAHHQGRGAEGSDGQRRRHDRRRADRGAGSARHRQVGPGGLGGA